MSNIRFAFINSASYVLDIVMAPPAFSQFWYYIASETAQIGDFWDGTVFVPPPPPPPPDRYQLRDALNAYLAGKENTRREAVLDTVIDGDMPETMVEFEARLITADPS